MLEIVTVRYIYCEIHRQVYELRDFYSWQIYCWACVLLIFSQCIYGWQIHSVFMVGRFTVTVFMVGRFTVSVFMVGRFTVSVFMVDRFTVSVFMVGRFTVRVFMVGRFTVRLLGCLCCCFFL